MIPAGDEGGELDVSLVPSVIQVYDIADYLIMFHVLHSRIVCLRHFISLTYSFTHSLLGRPLTQTPTAWTGLGNPQGGLVFTNAFSGSYEQTHEWTSFMSASTFPSPFTVSSFLTSSTDLRSVQRRVLHTSMSRRRQ